MDYGEPPCGKMGEGKVLIDSLRCDAAVVDAKDQVRRLLSLTGRHQHHAKIVLQCIQPVREVGSAVVDS